MAGIGIVMLSVLAVAVAIILECQGDPTEIRLGVPMLSWGVGFAAASILFLGGIL